VQGSKTRLQQWLGDFCKAILVIGARKEVSAAPLVIIFCTGGHRAAANTTKFAKISTLQPGEHDQTERCAGGKSNSTKM